MLKEILKGDFRLKEIISNETTEKQTIIKIHGKRKYVGKTQCVFMLHNDNNIFWGLKCTYNSNAWSQAQKAGEGKMD